jgi:hypothetical protein
MILATSQNISLLSLLSILFSYVKASLETKVLSVHTAQMLQDKIKDEVKWDTRDIHNFRD